jgi:hypothetical protein
MNRKKDIGEMELNSIDRILASEEPLIPSLGFLDSVMERVREEAAAPPPIPFPWKRALPGIFLTAGVFGWGAFELIRHGMPAVGPIPLATPQLTPSLAAELAEALKQAGWVALGLGISLLSWLLSRRLGGRSGLL